ncbi:MAG TPA: hypothetical protein VNL97_01660 [Solirubrobacterales bacterium]|nr:hypothetical protein [Solirubrobacterales bacterium]
MLEILIALVPLLLLLACLLAGCYPGYETIIRLAEQIASWRRPCAASRQMRPKALRFAAVTGGLLVAFGLASRPPPAALPS